MSHKFCSCSLQKTAINWLCLTCISAFFFFFFFVVAQKRSVILKEVSAMGEEHMQVSTCLHAPTHDKWWHGFWLCGAKATWPFILEGISKNQYFLCIFAAILSYQFDNGSIGISRRVILAVATNLTLSCREPASVHRAATKAEPKAMKSCWAAVLLESWSYTYSSPCPGHTVPSLKPPLPPCFL